MGSVAIIALLIKWFTFILIGVQFGRKTFALTGRLIWWSVLVIGCLTMIATILKDNDNVNFGQFNIGYVAIEFFGYACSLGGFAVFIYQVYHTVCAIMYACMKQLGERIIEVQ